MKRSRSKSRSYEDRPVRRRSSSRSVDAGGDRRYSRSVSRHRSRSRSERRSRSGSGDRRSSDDHIIVMHGLPYNTTESEILDFLTGCLVLDDKKGIHFVYGDDGRVTGDCYVELESEEDVDHALTKHKEHIGRRYIEVYRSTRYKMSNALDSRDTSEFDGVVKLRGLPYECTKEEIASFFLGLAIAPNGIAILTDHLGRTSGDGYVKFTEPQLVEKALEKHKEKIRHRYIEVYRSSISDMRAKMSRADSFSGRGRFGGFGGRSRDMGSRFGGMDNGGRFAGGRFGGGGGRMSGGGGGRRREEYVSHTGHYLHMRGLPFAATEDDIAKFFDPVVPVNIYIDYDRSGRATGEANVDFDCGTDARRALKKHRNMMKHRYIELFLNSSGPTSSRY